MSSTVVRHDIDWIEVIGTSILLLIVCAVIGKVGYYFLGPGWQKHEAVARAHEQQKLADVRGAGFTAFQGTTDTYEYGNVGFYYTAGSCNLTLGVDHPGAKYLPFIRLSGVDGGIIYLTFDKLKTLPETKHCFAG